MILYNEIRTLTLDQLTDELAAAGWDSTQTEIYAARAAVARLVCVTQGCVLLDSETGDTIRAATDDEAADSINAGADVARRSRNRPPRRGGWKSKLPRRALAPPRPARR